MRLTFSAIAPAGSCSHVPVSIYGCHRIRAYADHIRTDGCCHPRQSKLGKRFAYRCAYEDAAPCHETPRRCRRDGHCRHGAGDNRGVGGATGSCAADSSPERRRRQAVLDGLKSKGAVTDRLILDTLDSAQGARYQKLLDSGKFDAMFRAAEQTDEFSADDVRLSMALAALTTDDLGIDEILNITMEDLPDAVEWEADNGEQEQEGMVRPRWQFNWGIVTGTLYLNRKETRNARDAGYIVGLAASVCSAGFPVCYPVAAQAGGIGIAAGRYYEEGNCVKLKVIGPTLKPERHKKGQRNCK